VIRATALAVLFCAGCFTHAEDACRSCAIVSWKAPSPPPTPMGRVALVVLLHGAFGFGGEWTPIRAALDGRPELAYWVFSWPGPFGGQPPNRAEAFRRALQASLASLPPTTREVLVLAHSAGGPVAEYAARRVRVPPGVRLHIALLDAARISMAPYQRVESIDTPLGLALGETQEPDPGLPPGVVVDDYRASDPPRRHLNLDRARPAEIGTVSTAGEHIHYLGRHVTHGGSVALAGLPLIDKLSR
jgi:pimeloyl-ACP methyl ester carboxylesterase